MLRAMTTICEIYMKCCKAITCNKIVSRPLPACYFGTRILTYYGSFIGHVLKVGLGVWSDSV